MRIFFYITTLFLMMNSSSGKAQSKTVDSLLTVLKTVNADSHKVDILNNLANIDGYKASNFEKGLQYAQQAKTIAEQINPPYKKGITSALNTIGNIYYVQANYPEALNYFTAALKIQEEINNRKGIIFSNISIGNIYSRQGNYPDALKNYLVSLRIAEETGDKQNVSVCYNNIGSIYFLQGNYTEALNSFQATLALQDKIKDKRVIADANSNMGVIYSHQRNDLDGLKSFFSSLKINEEMGYKPGIAHCYANIGIIYSRQGNHQEALNNYFASLKIAEEIKDRRMIALCHYYIGGVYRDQGNYLDALKNQLFSLKIQEEIGDKPSAAMSHIGLGSTYLKLQNTSEALSHGTQGLLMAKTMGDLRQLRNAYETLASIDSARNDFQGAYENYKLYIVYKDSVANEEASQKILRQQMQFDYDKKENQLKYEKQLSEEQLLRSNQELGLRQKELQLINKEKDLQKLAYLKEKAERQEREKQLSLAEKDKLLQTSKIEVMSKENALQTAQLDIHKQEIATKSAQRNLFIGGTVLMLLLAGSIFVGLRRTSKEKKRSDELLLNILPAEVAEELKAKGSAVAKQMDEVTVLFTDFKSFTELSEKFTPTALVAEVNYCFSAFDHIMQKHGVEKIKTVGDAYMAAGGLPIANKTHAEDVVRAALDIQQFMFRYQSERQAAGNLFFEVRIGIHTGPVVAGIVGVKKFAYDIWGDTVNTASRMESSGEVGKINISETTYALVKDRFPCVHRGKISAKGKGEINMYFVEVLA